MRRSVVFAIALCGCQTGAGSEGLLPTGEAEAAPLVTKAGPPRAGLLREVKLMVAAEPSTEAPMSLTTSDGTGLELVKLDARAVVEGPLAFTELHLRFKNPQDRVLEGRFAITLPSTAAISRLAMRTESGWQEAEIVERQRARQIYEDFLHRRQDPALMEKEAGNQFSARIFPIPAKGEKDLIVSYSEELGASDARYRLPLTGLPAIAELDAKAMVLTVRDGALVYDDIRYSQRGIKPTGDFVAESSAPLRALRAGNLAAFRVKPTFSQEAAELSSLVVLFDTSASHALGYWRDVKRLGQLLKQIDPGTRVKVLAFDQAVAPIFEGRAGDFGPGHEAALLGHRALGASNLQAALRAAGRSKGYRRLLLIGDGMATAGAIEADALRREVKALGKFSRMDAVVVGGVNDRDGLARLVAGNLAEDGAVISGDESPEAWAQRLRRATRSGIEVEVAGAAWVWPRVLDGVQAGDEVVVYAEVPGERIDVTLRGVQAQTFHVRAVQVPEPLLARAAARAQIARLEDDLSKIEKGDDQRRKELHGRIVELSKRYRVLSDFTALLVLETAEDYARYGLDRKTLANILTVGERGLAVMSRDKPLVVATEAATGKDSEEKRKTKGDGSNDDLLTEVGGEEDLPSDKPKMEMDSGGRAAPPPASRPAPGRPAARRMAERAASAAPEPMDEVAAVERRPDRDEGEGDDFDGKMASSPAPLTGKMAVIHDAIGRKAMGDALRQAWAWRAEEPGDVLALIALGDALEASGDDALAARVYGSIIDLFPSRADLRRFAAGRLQRLAAGRELSIDALAKAAAQRPDHLSGHHLLGMALARAGQLEAAFAAVEAGLGQSYPDGRFAGGERVLREDLGLIARAWLKKSPGQSASILARLKRNSAQLAKGASTRFLLTWETDANDVDFHIFDAKGGHAFYSSKLLPSGGELYEDITTGYGPECFTIPGTLRAAPYRLKIHYYSRGPMGYGMGNLEIVRHDGEGNLVFESRPYLVMNDSAYVDLGIVR